MKLSSLLARHISKHIVDVSGQAECMRNYWLRIGLGALAVFAVGMIGVTLARQGVGRVRGVMEGSGPISFPLPFVAFNLEGQRLGSVERVTLHREAPKQISAVELQIRLKDSVLAHGLAGCRLAANLDKDSEGRVSVQANGRRFSPGVFSCLPPGGRDSPPAFQEFGFAVLEPGHVTLPLLLPTDVVSDLREGRFQGNLDVPNEDSVGNAAEAQAESVADAVEAQADSISQAAERKADSIVQHSQRLVDSLHREGDRRADSTRKARTRMADSARRS